MPDGTVEDRPVLRPTVNDRDFVDVNDDWFYICVYEPTEWATGPDTFQVNVSTANAPGYTAWNDDPTPVPVVKTRLPHYFGINSLEDLE